MISCLLKGVASGLVLFTYTWYVLGYAAAIAWPTFFAELQISIGPKMFLWLFFVEYVIAIAPAAIFVGVWLARFEKRAYTSALIACLTFTICSYVSIGSFEYLLSRTWWQYSLELAVLFYVMVSTWLGFRITSQGSGGASRRDALPRAPA